MPLPAGSQLGPYEVLTPIGAGGMGEVYRARDTKLGREVALKVLPAELAASPDRLARLQREARLLAALNHPPVAAIHGLEESGGITALVLELVEGRCRSGPHAARCPSSRPSTSRARSPTASRRRTRSRSCTTT